MDTIINNYVIIASLNSILGILIKRIPGFDIKFTRLGFGNACFMIFPIQVFSKPCLVNLISKDTHLVFSISWETSRCQQVFSKPCLVNLISKDTNLVFSIYRPQPGENLSSEFVTR